MSPAAQTTDTPIAGNLTDFFTEVDDDNPLDISVSIRQSGKVIVFHNRPLKEDIAWFEYHLGTKKLFFVIEDGTMHDIGMPLSQEVSNNMQNAHQIMMIYINADTGEGVTGSYSPLILHQT